MPEDAVERNGFLAAAALVVVGLVLRLRGLSEYWLNPDEGIYYSTLTRDSFGAFWSEVLANAHPPAFYLLLRGLGYLTWDFVWIRGAPALFGAATIWMVFLVGRELAGRGARGAITGLVAAGWIALSPEAIALSQVIRPYALLAALLASATYCLLRYCADDEAIAARPLLLGYAAALSLAVLTHYSALLGVGVLAVLLLHEALSGRLRGVRLRGAAAASLPPVLIAGGLYAWHLGSALDSDLMDQALGPGGWLQEWLVDSPQSAWRSLVTYQNFHVPAELRVRAALMLLLSIGLSAASRERAAAVLAGSALLLATAASAVGVYPFGPSRHNAWLVVFTVPALAWLIGRGVGGGLRRTALAGTALVALLLVAAPLERALGGPEARAIAVSTNATGERVLRRADLAPLVVNWLIADARPEPIVLTEQSYNVLMPLFAVARDGARTSPDSSLATFAYGARDVVVVRSWDWDDPRHLARETARIASDFPHLGLGDPRPILVVAGGWGSELVPHVPMLVDRGVIVEQAWAIGLDAANRAVPRMGVFSVEPLALIELFGPAR